VRVRNPEDGTYPVRQTGVEWTRLGSSVEGEGNSMRVASSGNLGSLRDAENARWPLGVAEWS
jgi:hypothetical protein